MKSLWTATLAAILSTAAFAQPLPPVQPASGPGGTDYPHAGVSVKGPYWANNRSFDDSFKYYIYEPASPAPATAPVILFLHGFAAFSVDNYGAWLEHMARRGHIVIWVQYQGKALTPLKTLAGNARAAYVDAMYRLQNYWWESHVKPAKDNQGRPLTTFAGHSAGAWLGAVLAAEASTGVPQIPAPLALTLIAPATKGLIPGANFQSIPATTKMTIVLGDYDSLACEDQALVLWYQTPQITNKDFLVARSDLHGEPYQLASHFYPNTDGYQDTAPVDARDFFITWKLSVANADCNTKGTNCEYGTNGGAAELNRGLWSDNVPVIPLIKVTEPANIPAIPGCN